ncbi:HD domain-containing protein [Rhodopirellula sp. JC740]|uniref:HD domain-containing protein n=1 Tax=Rhodopirellula halodulae TaxID=2894198 RepID=A0ABS8NDH4_9BACT|nr:HD domain-containing protein [Rhodopirellula sp. JC740]MCC9640888.1 HD domain-containing protein [Rhodopirellula sp. JC740]
MGIPELQSADRAISRLRIPPAMDVPVTDRVQRLIDTAPMRRLASISQLGLVSMVYPGATHSRLEHSLGVYAWALQFLRQLSEAPTDQVDVARENRFVEAFLVAALVHDAGHWPFCHPIEDMAQTNLPRHEERVDAMLRSGPIAEALQTDWSCDADDVMAILCPKKYESSGDPGASEALAFFASCLSGPIDVDKLDYLQRDSLHAGVPYGRNFDPMRIVSSLVRHPRRPKLAIHEKGRTAAEMMVFGRYVMFSEVYWHHAVRSATAMLQRAIHELQQVDERLGRKEAQSEVISIIDWMDLSESAWASRLNNAAEQRGGPVQELVSGLFGPTRRLLKRAAEFNVESGGDMHHMLARRPYWWLAACSEPLAKRISKSIGQTVAPEFVLIDAPPVKLEVDINIDIVLRSGEVATLGDVSPVASVLANRQFDNHVKRVRVFVPDWVRDALPAKGENMRRWLADAVSETESQWA